MCPHCHCFPLEDCIWWVSAGHGKKHCNWWCGACGGEYDWRAPNRVFVIQDSADHRSAKVFLARAAPQGICGNLINALNLLSNQQKDGDSPNRLIVPGLQEESRRKIMDGLKIFLMQSTIMRQVKIGDLQQETRSKKVVNAEVRDRFPGSCYSGRRG